MTIFENWKGQDFYIRLASWSYSRGWYRIAGRLMGLSIKREALKVKERMSPEVMNEYNQETGRWTVHNG